MTKIKPGKNLTREIFHQQKYFRSTVNTFQREKSLSKYFRGTALFIKIYQHKNQNFETFRHQKFFQFSVVSYVDISLKDLVMTQRITPT